MVKHTEAICRMLMTSCLSVCDHFVGLALKGLRWSFKNLKYLLHVTEIFPQLVVPFDKTMCFHQQQKIYDFQVLIDLIFGTNVFKS